MGLRLVTWNLERKRSTTPTGAAAVDHLRRQDADVMVLTEARRSFPAGDGHLVWSQTWGSEDERKVVMWSREPWTDVDDLGSSDLPNGRFVAGTTNTVIGPIRVLGICISWHMANVQYGDQNRKPWQDHIRYCEILELLIAGSDPEDPMVIAGDFNQRIPNPRPNRAEAMALAAALHRTTVFTSGDIEGCEVPGIDHIAARGLAAQRVWGWPNFVGGVRCSDHGGTAVELRLIG